MAKPVKGTKQSDGLNGTDGDDKIMGMDGNDTFAAGKGNDSIDGGKGVDTVVFSGNYDDYLISYKGTGNDKLTVQDTVAGRDGTDELKKIEWLKFNDATVNVQTGEVAEWDYYVNALIDESAQDPGQSGDQMFAGTGLSAGGFGIARNEDAGIELALKVHKRFDSPSAIPSSDNYADGELHFTVDAGPGNPPTNTRAEWNFDWSIATGLNGETTGLSDFTFRLLVDVDKGAGTNYHVWELAAGGINTANTHWVDTTVPANVPPADDEGIPNQVTQNSQNYGFGSIRSFIDDDPSLPGIQPYNFGPAEFDIVLEAYDGAQLIAQNHIVVDVV